MILDVYVDLFFLINFSMDYICLYITSKIVRQKVNAKKYIIASIIGGAYSVLALFFTFHSIIAFIIDMLICIIMISICFCAKGNEKRHVFGTALLYIGISMLLGGVMTAIFNLLNRLDIDLSGLSNDGAHTYTFAIIAVISAALSTKGISLITKKNRHKEYWVRIYINGRVCSLFGFVDTGNLVQDVLSGKSIIFIDRSASKDTIDPDAETKFYKGEIIYKGSRLIPISTANGSSMTLVFAPDKVVLKEKSQKEVAEYEVDCLISLTDIKKDTYSAIIPEELTRLNI